MSKGMSRRQFLGLSGGLAAFAGLVLLIVFLCIRRGRKNAAKRRQTPPQPGSDNPQ